MHPLVQAICDDPVAVLRDRSTAADQLVVLGAGAVPLIADPLANGWESVASPIDVLEALGHVLGRLALKEEGAVRSLLADPAIGRNKQVINHALAAVRSLRPNSRDHHQL